MDQEKTEFQKTDLNVQSKSAESASSLLEKYFLDDINSGKVSKQNFEYIFKATCDKVHLELKFTKSKSAFYKQMKKNYILISNLRYVLMKKIL